MSKGIKILVVACNTSSAVSLGFLRDEIPVPVTGVVEPGAKAAVAATTTKKIAVIGTEATINSGAYERAIRALDDSITVTGVACPLFVPIIEEGWINGDVVTLTAEEYLSSVKHNSVDSLVLGCTHYPMIKNVIKDIVKVPLIDSAVETAKEVSRILKSKNMLRSNKGKVSREFYVTDSPEKFAITGKRFLGHDISDISKINLE
jgi:glutamate racemase